MTGSIDFPDDVVTELGRDRGRADPLSDAFIEAAFANHEARQARTLVDRALDHGIGSVPEASPQLRALFEHLDTEPDWLDWGRVERGAKVLRRHGVDEFWYLGLISLEGYRFEMIHKPLVLTGAYTGGSAFGRYLETCRFGLDISAPGGLRPGGPGRKTAVTVRVMHSMIRHAVAPHKEWDGPRLGVPLSQNAQFGAIVLSFMLNQHTKLIGYLSSDEEILDQMHFWRYVGYLLGVEPAYYPETIDDWWRLTYLMFTADDTLDGPDSRMLAQSFVNSFEGWEHDKILGWTRFFLSDETFSANQLPRAGWRRWLPLTRVLPNLVDELGRRVLPGYADRLDARKRRQRARWLASHAEGRPARFTPVEALTR